MTTVKKDLQEMLKSAVHFGHATTKWNPKMKPYIHGVKQGVHVFDLNKTAKMLADAEKFLTDSAKAGKTILFVSTKQQATELVKAAAEDCKCPYVTQKWVPGLITNFRTIKQRIKYLKQLKDETATGEIEKYTKKDISKLKKTMTKLEAALGGVQELKKVPDILVVLDVHRDKIAVTEASRAGTMVVGICDSNADPAKITYPIPGNDDSIKSITYILNKLKEAIKSASK